MKYEDITTLFKDINDSPFYRSSSLINPLVTINKVYDPAYYNTSLYSSTYNSYYQDFYTQTFANEIKHRNYLILNAVNNPLFNMYMGVKYFVSDQDNLNDYSLIKTLNNYHLYENKEAYPLGYVNPQTLNIETYQKLTYPYNIEALLKYTITNDSLNKEIKSTLKKYSLPLNNLDLTKLSLKKSGDSTKIKAIDKVKLTLPLDEPVEDYLLIRLTMNYESTCSFGDTSITINGIKNTLTCRSWKYKNQNYTFDYVLTSPTKLDITISPGTFVITNIESYTLDKASIKEVQNNFEVFNINKAKTKGDIIEGDITTLGGYLNLSIPYDSNFTVYVDNEITPYELVDTAFMGLKLSKGTHHLKIVYQAQGQKFGLGISLIGILTTIMIALIERKKVKKCKKI